MILDNLEYISVQKQAADFPKHYHETFCISLIHKGTERIDLSEQNIYGEAGSITITNPYEIHSNPLMDSDIEIKFDTIYISKDLMKYLLDGRNITFFDRKINNHKANKIFIQLRNAIDEKNIQNITCFLNQFASILKEYSHLREGDYEELRTSNFYRVNDYIENNITDKLNLEELSKIANINKFGFVKKFKTSTGMSPMNYILMKKIFSAKKIITKDSELTQLAYDYNFSDIAHFSNTFKRYIGISPKSYQDKISFVS